MSVRSRAARSPFCPVMVTATGIRRTWSTTGPTCGRCARSGSVRSCPPVRSVRWIRSAAPAASSFRTRSSIAPGAAGAPCTTRSGARLVSISRTPSARRGGPIAVAARGTDANQSDAGADRASTGDRPGAVGDPDEAGPAVAGGGDTGAGLSPVVDGGTIVVINGPRFSTRAEARWHRQAGATMVGMTSMPEAAIAGELALCYTSVCLVTDLDAGVTRTMRLPMPGSWRHSPRTCRGLPRWSGRSSLACPRPKTMTWPAALVDAVSMGCDCLLTCHDQAATSADLS